MENKSNVSYSARPYDGSGSPDSSSREIAMKEAGSKQDSHTRTIGGGAKAQRYGPTDKLDRYLSSKPIISFGLTLQASWEAVAISFQSALLNGGPSTLVYGMLLSTFGSSAMAATLGEMASINPAVGAQYRWTAMLAPKGTNPRFLGYIQVRPMLFGQ
jgi:choline transport protein